MSKQEKTETELAAMSLDDIRALAASADTDATEEIAPVEIVEPVGEPEIVEDDDTPDEFVTEPVEVDLGDGSGIQIFIGRGANEIEALRDQNRKLAIAQANATKKIRELSVRVKRDETQTAQQTTDLEFVTSERLKTEPAKVIGEAIEAALAQERAKVAEQERVKAAWLGEQQRFIALHPEYEATPANAARLFYELERIAPGQYNAEGLEKAFGSLKAAGLVALIEPSASAVTDEDGAEPARIAQPAQQPTQQRSVRRSSTVSGRRSAPVVRTGPSEHELYDMPLEKLRDLANKQLAE